MSKAWLSWNKISIWDSFKIIFLLPLLLLVILKAKYCVCQIMFGTDMTDGQRDRNLKGNHFIDIDKGFKNSLGRV